MHSLLLDHKQYCWKSLLKSAQKEFTESESLPESPLISNALSYLEYLGITKALPGSVQREI